MAEASNPSAPLLPRVVLDTNVLLVSLSQRSPYHGLFRALRERRYTLCLTTSIALEYEEVVARHMGRETAEALMSFLSVARNIAWVHRYYRWHLIEADLIEADPDDDKFVDCAVAAGAAFLVTEDRHFDALQRVPFPHVTVIGAAAFQKALAVQE